MALDAEIRTALETALFAVSGFPASRARHLENAPGFTPTIGTPWARVSHLWSNETLGSLPASGGSLWRTGFTQVSLFHPLQDGTTAGDTLAQAIRDAIPAGKAFSIGGRALQIMESRRWQGQRDGAWWLVPVDLVWRMRALNPPT